MIVTSEIEALVDRALAEDLSAGDPTTDALVPSELEGRAVIVADEEGVLAGVEIARTTFLRVDQSLTFTAMLRDGAPLSPHDPASGREGDVIAKIEGPVASILTAERTALNFMRHLSGIASETARYVEAVAGFTVRILDTRKTTPGLRSLEKYAVRMGGGRNHRYNLGDGVLIKDNHIDVMRRAGLDLRDAVKKARAEAPHTLTIEVEVEDLDQVWEALDAGADALLLDNMSLEVVSRAVEMARGKAVLEASGRINLANVRDVAATGVDLISVGALTHSSRALDISLDLV